MAGKIHRYDCYDLRKFKSDYIRTFVDIGANVGSTAIMARILFPKARVVAFEPAPETFEKLSFFTTWQIECYQLALGDGTKLSYHKNDKNSGLSRFYNESEKKWWVQNQIFVDSKPLSEIFEIYKIDTTQPYIIKIDCEGGERFLLNDNKATELIRGSVQSIYEIHDGIGGTKEQWKTWFNQFKDTHELRVAQWQDKHNPNQKYVYSQVPEFDFDKKATVELVKKE